MKNVLRCTALTATLLATGCATSGGGYQGVEAEKTYDKNLEAVRQTAVINNDDYYEIHKDNRIVVIADGGDMKLWLSTGDIPYRLTRIGGGPKGETVVFGIATPENKKKEGFGSVEMFDGRRAGAEKNFYAEVLQDNRWYVFGTWAELDSFRKTGRAEGLASGGTAPTGEPVVVAQPTGALMERFNSIHGAGSPVAVVAPAAEPAPIESAPAPAKPRKKKTSQ